MTKDHLTTEWLRKRFKNNFDLCNASIAIARRFIRDGGVDIDLQALLEEVKEGADSDNSSAT